MPDKSPYSELKERVLEANLKLVKEGLVVLTWGNASEVDRERGVYAIKPSGVSYETMKSDDIVIVSLETGEVVEGSLRPSSDSPTHHVLYKAFPSLGGIVHTHSEKAVSWAQANREIPCMGTTHADTFYGSVPLTRRLTEKEINDAYEVNSGKVIVEHFTEKKLNPEHVPGVLLPFHGPFTWGKNGMDAVKNSIILEEVAKMAMNTLLIAGKSMEAPDYLKDKHFLRKHGPGAYYGQK
ncbi:L-ribulose-5-phosphate 4-epimerase [Spirochaeta isovalerica]|uniref:L-ribulose-5-phosphate 4-epimerase n=1 Tax=Spirochaeta isovalerica TaxID=150 RepID=A0A841R7C3_9SPIO|nr:L-ribulose-5-phosphate 4-epimerase [Spirochaeta isovalerica]MBB6479743.1 L-ribulose-5-phosphate 4-epimerase [Spirochaeta isovalerica]